MIKLQNNPIERIEWKNPYDIVANDYNPNVVQPSELELLKFSIMQNGWIQPTLITHEGVLIDGFHRTTLARLEGWLVSCCVMELSEAERMILTIRINRAKGTHVAFKMSEIVKRLVMDFELTKDYIAYAIGATEKEIDLLLQEDVFQKLEIKQHRYSMAWEPKK
jgi:ParB-like chromosome segregation protein Spo0J